MQSVFQDCSQGRIIRFWRRLQRPMFFEVGRQGRTIDGGSKGQQRRSFVASRQEEFGRHLASVYERASRIVQTQEDSLGKSHMAAALLGLHPAFPPPKCRDRELVLSDEPRAMPFAHSALIGGCEDFNSGRPRHGIQSDFIQGGVAPESDSQCFISRFKRPEDPRTLPFLPSSPIPKIPHSPEPLGQPFIHVTKFGSRNTQIGCQGKAVQTKSHGVERGRPGIELRAVEPKLSRVVVEALGPGHTRPAITLPLRPEGQDGSNGSGIAEGDHGLGVPDNVRVPVLSDDQGSRLSFPAIAIVERTEKPPCSLRPLRYFGYPWIRSGHNRDPLKPKGKLRGRKLVPPQTEVR